MTLGRQLGENRERRWGDFHVGRYLASGALPANFQLPYHARLKRDYAAVHSGILCQLRASRRSAHYSSESSCA